MALKDYQIYATDSLIKRDRVSRAAVFATWVGSTFLIPITTASITKDWFDNPSIGLFTGLTIQAAIHAFTYHRFIVKNGAMRAFVTVDNLRVLLNKYKARQEQQDDEANDTYVSYGPGLHISYPWEAREATRNVSLEETSESFEVTIQTPKGDLTVKGSVRLRPDITRLVPFLGGVAVMAGDVTDLIKSFLIGKLANMETVMEALQAVPDINKELDEEFVKGKTAGNPISDFERRFGVSVGDITISEILPSDALRKTMTGISEAEIIAEGAAITAGYPTAKEARQAIKDGLLTQADLNEARDRFMAASDNIKMNLGSNEYRIKIEGLDKLDPEVAKAILTIAPLIAGRATGNNPKGRKVKQNG